MNDYKDKFSADYVYFLGFATGMWSVLIDLMEKNILEVFLKGALFALLNEEPFSHLPKDFAAVVYKDFIKASCI